MIIAWIICICACFLLLISALAFLRSKDLFTMTHVVMIVNCYIIPLLLLGIEIEYFSFSSLFKITILILLNLVIANLLCYLILKNAFANKILPDADDFRQ